MMKLWNTSALVENTVQRFTTNVSKANVFKKKWNCKLVNIKNLI